jgi:hypothetical protein
MVLQFRQHRKAALSLEIQRLQGLKEELVTKSADEDPAAAADSPSLGEGNPAAAEMEGWDPYTHAALMTGANSNLHVQEGSSSCGGGAEGGEAGSGSCAMPEAAVL